jgi:hypothetical protein
MPTPPSHTRPLFTSNLGIDPDGVIWRSEMGKMKKVLHAHIGPTHNRAANYELEEGWWIVAHFVSGTSGPTEPPVLVYSDGETKLHAAAIVNELIPGRKEEEED